MKAKLFFPILFLIFVGCKKETNEKLVEVTPDVFILKPSEALVNTIMNFLPPGQNIFLNNSVLFSDTIQKKIVLTKESEVFVNFIDEGAGYRNSLLWYSYNSSNPPLKISDISNNVLFANISKKGEGGELEEGYTKQLGNKKFPAGTVIGFSLVMNGWKDGTIDYNDTTFYTNYELNLNGKQQYILFKEAISGNIVIGFEDMSIDKKSDKDYNDILINVLDNKDGLETTSFDLSKVIVK